MLSATLSTLFFVAAALGAPTTPDPTATTSTTTTSTTAFPTTALGGSTKPGANGYHIVTKDPTTGKAYCLDLRRGKFEDQAPLQMYGCDTGNNPNQIWHMAGNTAPNQDGLQITITNPKNKDEVWCLTNSEPNYNRAHVRITHCNPTDQSQLWKYKVKDGEPNHIYNKWGLAMDVMESNWIDGADIQVFRNGDTNPNQHWDFVPR